MSVVDQGAQAPESFRMKVARGTSEIDLTTVTAVTFYVRPPGVGAVMMWAAAILPGATPTQLVASHTFQLTDTATLGRHIVRAHLTVPAGVVRTLPISFTVVDSMQVGA